MFYICMDTFTIAWAAVAVVVSLVALHLQFRTHPK